MRDWILKIHIYAGLLCSPYLIIFGLSSLHFNHKFTTPADDTVSWTHPIRLDPSIEKRQLGLAVRDSLGLMGWGPPWEVRQSDEEIRVRVVRPAKRYDIRIPAGEGLAYVEETRLGYWAAINSLHALMGLPNAPFMSWWGVYTEICVWVVLFSAASGVYVWAIHKRERRLGWILLIAGSGTSLLLMIYIVVWG